MLCDDFIDEILEDVLEVSSSDATYSTQRTRVLRAAQQCVDALWVYDEWDFSKTHGATTTLTAGNSSAVCPASFYRISTSGSVYIQNDNELFPIAEYLINRLRNQRGTQRGKPEFYCISGQDSTTKRPKIQFDCLADTSYTIVMDHELTRPTLVDDSGATNGLDQIPDEHVRSVLKPMVIELLASGSGDGRVVGELGPRAKALLAEMKSKRNQNLPDDSRIGDLGLRTFGMH